MEPGLKARMSPGLKGREMTLGLFCSPSFSEKEVLISAHLRHNSLAQMKAKKQTRNCCEWEQRSQEHVRSFPCEQCSVSDVHQQSRYCLRWELPNIQDCPRDPASPPKTCIWIWGWVHGCSMGEDIDRRDSTRKTSQVFAGIPHGDSPFHTLQIHELLSSLKTALKTHPAHPGEISSGISKHRTLRLLGALLEEY